MEKIAYICLCHQDPQFIARTAQVLQYGEDAFFVHVDAKKDDGPFRQACAGLPNVHFAAERIKNYWGGFQSIRATMETIRYAMTCGDFTRFVLLQGQDYPLYSPAELHAFFAANHGVEYCKGRNVSASKDKKDYMRVCGYWYLDNEGKRLHEKLIRGVCHHILYKTGIKYRRASFQNGYEKWDIYHGWAQFAISGECAKYVLDIYDNNASFNRFMMHRFPPDELYIPTVVYNSPFRERVSNQIIERRDGEKTLLNLTYFEYPNQVTIFQDKADYEWLKKTKCLFVRKVNSNSGELLDEIDQNILKGREEL